MEDDRCQGEIHSSTIVVVVWKHSKNPNKSQIVWRLDKLPIFYDVSQQSIFCIYMQPTYSNHPTTAPLDSNRVVAMGQNIFPTLSSRLSS
jgi:hypothetical protein